MMKTFKKTTFLLLTVLAVIATSCSKDKSSEDDPIGSTGRPGDPHSYHIQFVEGENAGYEVSGEVQNDNGRTLYFNDDGEEGTLWGMANDEMNIEGNFKEGPGGYIEFPDAPWSMQMYELNKAYVGKDISFTVTNEKREGLPMTGFSTFKLTFDGIFYHNIDEDELHRIKGTLIFNLPEM